MKARVLVVEDEARIARLIRANLQVSGYQVTLCKDGAEALSLVERFDPDLILLDLMLPGLDGFTVCQRIREFSPVPIIMVTAKDDPVDRVKGLDLGADDYLVKPFVVEELLARVRAVLRRTQSVTEAEGAARIDLGSISINFAEHAVYRAGERIRLTPTEYRLFAHMAQNQGKTLTHEELLSRVWGPEYRDALEYLRVTIGRLRRKVEDDPSNPKLIINHHGVGYTLRVPGGQG